MATPALLSAELVGSTEPQESLSLQLWEQPTPDPFFDARCRRFEYSSRGDRVPGRLLLPPTGQGPFPLVLLQHGAGGSKEAPYMDAAAPWVHGGAAVASIDWPLHGERRSAKLTERLLASLSSRANETGQSAPVPSSARLVFEFVRQSVADAARCIDAMAQVAEVDDQRVAYAAFSLGSMLGAIFCALDPRPCAAALALGGAGLGPSHLDPGRYIADLAPRPLLMVNTRQDDLVPRPAAEALFAAAAEPKSIEWYDGGHDSLPGQALKSMWQFLQRHLGAG
jgi:hypothetical protein